MSPVNEKICTIKIKWNLEDPNLFSVNMILKTLCFLLKEYSAETLSIFGQTAYVKN